MNKNLKEYDPMLYLRASENRNIVITGAPEEKVLYRVFGKVIIHVY